MSSREKKILFFFDEVNLGKLLCNHLGTIILGVVVDDINFDLEVLRSAIN